MLRSCHFDKFIKEYMLINSIKPGTIKDTNKMLDVKGACRKYGEEKKEAKENEKLIDS